MKLYSTRPPRRPSHERVLAVEAGQVMCPHGGIVDIEDCWICPAYRGLSGGSIEGLVCNTEVGVMSIALRSATA